MGVNNWWHAHPPSPPLDVVAGERFEKRKHRMENPLFLACCELAKMANMPSLVTPRQARKFNQRKGLASRFFNEAKSLL